ncbi:DUF6478 family protein [Mesobacterium sp. TK19101]|uniref:DUF6478 family protein n=1 Tax=Mesobacterium hydrothermale TaxID=3111907 RepID=A0ABU6HHG1_9RHOB|nr:DUF6478 family protein [Mesobacterium sp. TK19101]MEC3861366.1 DUF6478 family protein [Mesobacterium sp. TK19101]
MAGRDNSRIDQFMDRAALRRWTRRAIQADQLSLEALHDTRTIARKVRHQLNAFLHTADERLAKPRIGSTSFPTPRGTDWSWRPGLWRAPMPLPGVAGVVSGARFGEEVALFHDCPLSELTLRQRRNTRGTDLAAFGLQMDVLRFDGSYLSLAIDLPAAARQGLTREHIVQIDLLAEVEHPLDIFARLNLHQGPNAEQLVQEVVGGVVEFDLSGSGMSDAPVESAWIDLIFDRPTMNQVVLRDLTVSRRLRAQF